MSIKAMTWVFEQDELKGNHKLVMLALADFCDDQGLCWPSVGRIAKKSSISERSVQRILGDLVDQGWLGVNRAVGRGHTSRYWMLFEKGDRLAPLVSEKVTTGTEKVTNRTIKGDTAMSPEPSVEPSIEPSNACEQFFELFWKLYPKRLGDNPKQPARKAYERAIKAGADPDDIEQGIRRYAFMCQTTGKLNTEFIPHATTWLNQRRWEDESTHDLSQTGGKTREEWRRLLKEHNDAQAQK